MTERGAPDRCYVISTIADLDGTEVDLLPALERTVASFRVPKALWELFLGVYCTIWGFKRDAPILSGGTAAPSVGAPALSGSAG